MSVYLDFEKFLGSFHLRVNLQAENETVALLGASGSGKTLTLKCIAGILTPDRGKIVVDGTTWFDSEKKINLTPQQRQAGLLFQNYALFPHMSVEENVCAGAMREPDRKNRAAAVERALRDFDLVEVKEFYPHQLSGGQQQRTALARILVSKPRLLLLDEPFSALDSHLRFRMEQEVRQVLGTFDGAVMLVSHDRDEVYRMADSVAIMEHGTISVVGPKERVFAAPVTRGAAALTGCKNISPVRQLDETHVESLDWGITLKVDRPVDDADAVGIRMHSIRPGQGENSFRCRVTEVVENPFSVTVMLQAKDYAQAFAMELSREQWEGINDNYIYVNIKPEEILLLKDRQGGQP